MNLECCIALLLVSELCFDTRTESAAKMRVADFTASGDLHPAPKNIPFSAKNIAQDDRNCKLFFSQLWYLVRSRLLFTGRVTKRPLGEVTLSTGPIPRAPVTLFIIILSFESPATTSPAA